MHHKLMQKLLRIFTQLIFNFQQKLTQYIVNSRREGIMSLMLIFFLVFLPILFYVFKVLDILGSKVFQLFVHLFVPVCKRK